MIINRIDSHLINTVLHIKLTGEASSLNPAFSIKSNNNDIYSFTIRKWFLPSNLGTSPYDQHAQACQGNYVPPSIEDFTNSDPSIITNVPCKTDNNSNNCLNISTNHYYRRVGTSL